MIVGLGVDVVDIARARRLLDSYGDKILAKVCTPAESAYIRLHVDGAQRFAARLAAKEAAFKALAGSPLARAIGWREIEVIAADGGPPKVVFRARADERARALHVSRALVSLSHSDSTAIAVVLLEADLENR